MNTPRSRTLDLGSSRRRLKTSPAVSLWKPQIVLATPIDVVPTQHAVIAGEPSARPEALRARLGATQSLLAHLDSARESLTAASAGARARAAEATSTREHVSATIAAYRAEAALDDVLTGAWRRVSALMEERGLR